MLLVQEHDLECPMSWHGMEDREEWAGTPRSREASPDELIEGVKVIAASEMALLCARKEFGQCWVPRSQIKSGTTIHIKGDEGTLVIPAWLYQSMQGKAGGAPSQDDVTVEDCICVSEARSGKAISVRFPDGREEWMPVSQIREASEVRYDGDSGKLVVSAWIAGEKNLG